MDSARTSEATLANATVTAAARASYGRLLALLAARNGDIAASEDALAEAFAAALTAWPHRGVPSNPDAWLLTVARNRVLNVRRHEAVALNAINEVLTRLEERTSDTDTLPDQRLALMFVCAHPAIQADIRTPLMLQTILGLDAARIASAFLVSPTAMGQRLVRAKAKIKAAGIRFQMPEREALPERLDDVLSAIYAAFGTAWDSIAGSDQGGTALAAEAIFLARVVVLLLPQEPEALGLLALMLYCDARTAARWGADGQFVPLKEQDSRLWSRDKIVEAEQLLEAASKLGRFGRFQCEAAIQSVHIQSPITGRTQWNALRSLHELLLQQRPSVGAFVSYAAVLLASQRSEDAHTVLNSLDPADISSYQPYWVTLAAVHTARGAAANANDAQTRAIGLTENAAVRAFLLRNSIGSV